jgi:hypothetical protein
MLYCDLFYYSVQGLKRVWLLKAIGFVLISMFKNTNYLQPRIQL